MRVDHPGELTLEPFSIWVCSRKRGGKPPFRVKLFGGDSSIHTIRQHLSADESGPRVVKVEGNCPNADSLFRLVRAWWLSRNVMATVEHKSYYFTVEPCGSKWVVSLTTTSTRSATPLSKHMRQHGIVLNDDAPMDWEAVGVMLCEHFVRYAQRSGGNSVIASHTSAADTDTDLNGIDAYTALVAQVLTEKS